MAAAREVLRDAWLWELWSGSMEDYEEDLYGVEDDFQNQFAAELEVLAELEGGRGSHDQVVVAPCYSMEGCVDGIGSGWEFTS